MCRAAQAECSLAQVDWLGVAADVFPLRDDGLQAERIAKLEEQMYDMGLASFGAQHGLHSDFSAMSLRYELAVTERHPWIKAGCTCARA